MDRKTINYKRMIGEGAFGEVYLAEVTGVPGFQNQTMEVAVKQLRLSDFIARHGHHSQQMEDFLREAKEMSKVDYPYVIKLLAVCTLDYPMLLIEEFMNNGDLLGILKDNRPSMPLPAQLNFAFQVSDGMRYLADELSCVHRDLAARNILVHQDDSEFMHTKIADFGLSRHLYSDMYKHQGTKPRPLPAKWMALESLMYFTFTTKSDVWSYGVLLWEIMTMGRSPYPGVENRELLEQIEEKGLKLSKPKLCPPEIYEVILDCTQHQPDERPTFGELKDTMAEFFTQAMEGKMTHPKESPTTSSLPSSTSLTTTDHATEEGPQPPRPEKSPQLQRPPSPKTPPPSSKPPPPTPASSLSPLTKTTPPSSRPTSTATGNSSSKNSSKTTPNNNSKSASPSVTKANSVSTGTKTNSASMATKTNSVSKATKANSASNSATVATKDDGTGNSVVPEGMTTEDDGMVEMTGGHLYYLLDPLEDEVKGEKSGGRHKRGSGRSPSQSNHWRTESGRPNETPPTQSTLRES
ncbi:Tyrosine-protein kinase SRK3 (Fragment) [Geodia barretti]